MPTDNVGAVEVNKLSRVSDEENRMEEANNTELPSDEDIEIEALEQTV